MVTVRVPYAVSDVAVSAACAGYKVKGVAEAVEAEKSIKLSKLPQVGPTAVAALPAAGGGRCRVQLCMFITVNMGWCCMQAV